MALKGVFDGCGHKISGIYIIKNSDEVALFTNSSKAIIKNLTVEKSEIINQNELSSCTAGIVAGYYYVKIYNCHVVDCEVTGKCFTNDNSNIQGTYNATGIAFYVDEIQNCFCTGNVISDDSSKCLEIAYAVSVINNCYYKNGCAENDYLFVDDAGYAKNVTSEDDSSISSQSFVDTLNSNAAANNEWLEWELREGSKYPQFIPVKDLSGYCASVAVSEYIYNGNEQKPVVSVAEGSDILKPDVDYTVTYVDNIDVGTGTAIINGINKYMGSITINFNIVKPIPEVKTTANPNETSGPLEKISSTANAIESNIDTNGTIKKGIYLYRIYDAGKMTIQLTGITNKKIKKAEIPDNILVDGKKYNVVSIAESAMANCSKLKSVIIGKNVKRIGKNAFAKCGSLKRITFKTKKLVKVNKNAFCKINSKAVIKVPSVCVKKYKKEFSYLSKRIE